MSTPTEQEANNDETETEAESQGKDDGLVESRIEELKVAELKEELRNIKCPVCGKKDKLVVRLKKMLH